MENPPPALTLFESMTSATVIVLVPATVSSKRVNTAMRCTYKEHRRLITISESATTPVRFRDFIDPQPIPRYVASSPQLATFVYRPWNSFVQKENYLQADCLNFVFVSLREQHVALCGSGNAE